MAIYYYKAKSGPEKAVNGEIEAPSQEIAVEKLTQMGLTPITVREKGAKGERAYVPSAASARAKSSDIDIFTRQLASLIRAGVPVLRALSLIATQTETKSLKHVIDGLSGQIRGGKMLSEAMAKYPRIFNGLYISMLKAGEKGGVLDEVLYKLADYREKEAELRKKIQAAAAYPVFVIIVGILTVFAMLTFFLPKLMGIYTDMSQLPLPTRILKQISNFMQGNWLWIFAVITIVFAALFKTRPGSHKKYIFDSIKLNIPLIRKFVNNVEIARFARTLGLLIKNGISVHESLELAANTLDNDALKEKLGKVRGDILNRGSTLSASLKEAGVFPSFAVNMISVGEEGGRLEESLAEISNVYEREVEQSIKVMTSLLEPVLILIVGGVVGFIVFAMLLPIFNIGLTVK